MNNEEKILEILGGLTETVSEIKTELEATKEELKEFRSEANQRFDTLEDKFDVIDAKNADNHVIIKGDMNNIKETLEEIEVDLKLVKKTTVANSEDIEKLTIVK